MNPQQQYGSAPWMQQQPKKGWLGRNWKWLVPTGCLGSLLLLGGFVAVIVLIVFSAIKSTEVYQSAVEMAKASPKVQEQLGTPIKEGWFVKGSVKTRNGGGYASLWIPISGPKGSAEIYAEAWKSTETNAGNWTWESLLVNVKGGETFSILERPTEDATSTSGEENLSAPIPDITVREVPPRLERAPGVVRELPVAPDIELAPDEEDEPPPPPKPTPSPSRPKIISGGVLNGKAISKPQPPYPPVARAVKAQGTVTVQVTIDEEGRVVSANAVSGHPLLQAAAVAAARQARFSPTQLSGQPVRVSGVITYNFVLE
ncbi:MAG TPA: cytochrome c oxidase assembly factor Coa1 family protein [Pyrinomonadaceae bacterium]|jgi:TonB family protein